MVTYEIYTFYLFSREGRFREAFKLATQTFGWIPHSLMFRWQQTF